MFLNVDGKQYEVAQKDDGTIIYRDNPRGTYWVRIYEECEFIEEALIERLRVLQGLP